jgi:hypothetical protein
MLTDKLMEGLYAMHLIAKHGPHRADAVAHMQVRLRRMMREEVLEPVHNLCLVSARVGLDSGIWLLRGVDVVAVPRLPFLADHHEVLSTMLINEEPLVQAPAIDILISFVPAQVVAPQYKNSKMVARRLETTCVFARHTRNRSGPLGRVPISWQVVGTASAPK